MRPGRVRTGRVYKISTATDGEVKVIGVGGTKKWPLRTRLSPENANRTFNSNNPAAYFRHNR